MKSCPSFYILKTSMNKYFLRRSVNLSITLSLYWSVCSLKCVKSTKKYKYKKKIKILEVGTRIQDLPCASSTTATSLTGSFKFYLFRDSSMFIKFQLVKTLLDLSQFDFSNSASTINICQLILPKDPRRKIWENTGFFGPVYSCIKDSVLIR